MSVPLCKKKVNVNLILKKGLRRYNKLRILRRGHCPDYRRDVDANSCPYKREAETDRQTEQEAAAVFGMKRA